MTSAHDLHAASDVAPTTSEKCPRGQVLHAVAPPSFENVPASQAAQDPPTQRVPVGHKSHADDAEKNVPGLHAAQPSSSLVAPPAPRPTFPRGQSRHVDMPADG